MGENASGEEIGVSAELTPTGFTAKVKSRAASAIDRLWGVKADRKSIPIEAENAEAIAISNARVKLIDALGDLGIERLKRDPDFAARAVENFLPSLVRKQANKDAVLDAALEDLRGNPADPDQRSPTELDETFLDRFERYAEEASTEQLREKWGRVLAAEIRKPNTFSGKVLRVVDELDAETAALFERVCQHHADGVLLKPSLGVLSFREASTLTVADLLVEPGLGQIRQSKEVTDAGGETLWFWGFGEVGFSLSQTSGLPKADPDGIVLQHNEGRPALPIYVLTEVGRAITSILTDHSVTAVEVTMSKVAEHAPHLEMRKYVKRGDEWQGVAKRPPSDASQQS